MERNSHRYVIVYHPSEQGHTQQQQCQEEETPELIPYLKIPVQLSAKIVERSGFWTNKGDQPRILCVFLLWPLVSCVPPPTFLEIRY